MQILQSRWRNKKYNCVGDIMSKRALIVVNLAGFLNFLWNDIDILQKMGYRVDVAMNGCMSDGKETKTFWIL